MRVDSKKLSFFIFIFSFNYIYTTLRVMANLNYLYVHALYLSISAWSRRRHCYNCGFWVIPSWVYSSSLYHFSAPTPTLFPLPLLFLLFWLLSKILAVAPLLFHLLADLLAISFSRLSLRTPPNAFFIYLCISSPTWLIFVGLSYIIHI